MDEHPGDTLGKRFLTFWGALAAIVAVALLLGLYRWMAIPSDAAANDGGAAARRAAILAAVQSEQRKELEMVAAVKPGQTVRVPAASMLPYFADVLAAKKASPSAIKTPAALTAEAEAKAKATHDPNLSKFEGK